MIRSFCIGLLLAMVLLAGNLRQANATHLMGGELTYQFEEAISGGAFYSVKLIVYRYCDTILANPAPLDDQMFLGIYINDTLDPTGPKVWYATEILSLTSSEYVTSIQGGVNCNFETSACIQKGEYNVTILIPDNPDGFHLAVERCCRNGNILNLSQPGAAGMTFYAFIPGNMQNSTPQIYDVSVPYVCSGDSVTIVNNAIDPDGDSLSYALVIPYNGYSGQSNPAPDPFLDNNPYALPIPEIVYNPGYTASQPFGAGGFASIDPINGLTKYFFPNQGFYVAAIEIREYRNGVLISKIRRDLQFIAIVCSPNALPALDPSSSASTFTISEGQQLCFFSVFDDADGDSLYLTASGPIFDPLQTNPPATMADAQGLATVTSQFCWTPVCGMARPTPYQFIVSVRDNGCPPKIVNQIYSVYVTDGPASLTPTVAITRSPSGILCQGSLITLTANPFLGGSAPIYSWKKNGIPVGTNSPTYSSSTFVNGDVVTVKMISNASCALVDTALSPPFVINISNIPAPDINITSSFGGVLCPQQICLFTANVQNGGNNPSYQWIINGNNGGTNSNLFTAASPSGLLSVYCVLTPSTGCPPQPSNTILYDIPPTIEPEVVMYASTTDTICPGQEVMFTADAFATPGYPTVFNWLINGANQFINNDTAYFNNLHDGDEVVVTVTSGYPCLSPTYGYAEPLYYYIYDSLEADLSDGPFELCLGQPLDLELSVAGGKADSYDFNWSFSNYNGPSIQFGPVATGYYYASVKDLCFDKITDSVYVNVLPVPVADFEFSPLRPSLLDSKVTFTDQSIDAIQWAWSFGDSLFDTIPNPIHIFADYGTFSTELIVTNDVGCKDTTYKEIIIDDFITAYVPSAFTPNDDGKNDEFSVVGFSNGGYSMKIFNRWGQVVFSSDSGYGVWTGKNNDGTKCPQGIYVYQIEIAKDKKHRSVRGTVTLVR